MYRFDLDLNPTLHPNYRQCCTSRILIFIHPGSQNPDPGSNNTNKRGDGKFVCPTFCSYKYHKIDFFYFGQVKNKIYIKKYHTGRYRTFYPKIVAKL